MDLIHELFVNKWGLHINHLRNKSWLLICKLLFRHYWIPADCRLRVNSRSSLIKTTMWFMYSRNLWINPDKETNHSSLFSVRQGLMPGTHCTISPILDKRQAVLQKLGIVCSEVVAVEWNLPATKDGLLRISAVSESLRNHLSETACCCLYDLC